MSASSGFRNAVVAGGTLVRDFIKSTNFVTGVSGWIIRRTGSAEFQDITARGTIVADQIKTSDVQTDPRIWINDPADDPNSIIFFAPDQPDNTPLRELAKIKGAGFAGQREILLRAWGTDTSDTEDTEILISGHNGGPNGFIQFTAEDTIFFFAPGSDGFDGLRYNTPILTSEMMRAYDCACTTNLALSGAGFSDIAGMSITFNTNRAGAECTIAATFDTNCTVAAIAGDLATYRALLDGVQLDTQTPYADEVSPRRVLVPGAWKFVVPAAGTHTLKFQGRKSSGSGTTSCLTSVTRATLTVLDNSGGL